MGEDVTVEKTREKRSRDDCTRRLTAWAWAWLWREGARVIAQEIDFGGYAGLPRLDGLIPSLIAPPPGGSFRADLVGIDHRTFWLVEVKGTRADLAREGDLNSARGKWRRVVAGCRHVLVVPRLSDEYLASVRASLPDHWRIFVVDVETLVGEKYGPHGRVWRADGEASDEDVRRVTAACARRMTTDRLNGAFAGKRPIPDIASILLGGM